MGIAASWRGKLSGGVEASGAYKVLDQISMRRTPSHPFPGKAAGRGIVDRDEAPSSRNAWRWCCRWVSWRFSGVDGQEGNRSLIPTNGQSKTMPG